MFSGNRLPAREFLKTDPLSLYNWSDTLAGWLTHWLTVLVLLPIQTQFASCSLPFFISFVLFLLNCNPLSFYLRHPSNNSILHQAIMLPILSQALSVQAHAPACLPFLPFMTVYVLAIVFALFFEVLRLFVCSRDSIPVVFQAAIWCLQRETTIMKYIFKNRVVLTS